MVTLLKLLDIGPS